MRAGTLKSRGMTLIELLLVIVILGMMSGMAVTMTADFDDRARYDETARRLITIRTAVLGPDAVASEGQLPAGGFVQDVGALPHAANDLVMRPDDLPPRQYDPTWQTAYGWHGPYVPPLPSRTAGSSDCRLYDDWGNDFIGWAALGAGTLPPTWRSLKPFGDSAWQNDYAICSLGSNGKSDAAVVGIFEREMPEQDQPLIRAVDWQADLSGGRLQVTLVNQLRDGDWDFAGSPVRVRLRILVPQWESGSATLRLGYPLSSDDDPFASDVFSLGSGGTSVILDLAPYETPEEDAQKPYRSSVDSAQVFTRFDGRLHVPHGRRMLFLVNEDGSPLAQLADGSKALELAPCCAELCLSRRLTLPLRVTLYLTKK